MTNLAKILLSTAVVSGVGAVIALVAENEEKNDREVIKDKNGNDKVVVMAASNVTVDKNGEVVEDKSVLKRIKRYVKKRVIKVLAWVTLHMEQIEAAGALIGLCSAVIGIAGSIRDFKNGNDTQAKLDQINNRLDNYFAVYNENIKIITDNQKVTGDYLERAHKAEVHNQRIIVSQLDAIARKTGVDLEEMYANIVALDVDDKKTA